MSLHFSTNRVSKPKGGILPRQFKDYDALAAEKEPIRFKAAGRDYELPAELPARLMLDAHRMANDGAPEDGEAADFGMRILARIFPEGEWDRLVDNMGQDTLGALTQDIMAVYFGGEDEGSEDGGKAETGESPSTTSSPTGEPSIPTSNGGSPEAGGTSTGPTETQEPLVGNGSVSELPTFPKVQASS